MEHQHKKKKNGLSIVAKVQKNVLVPGTDFTLSVSSYEKRMCPSRYKRALQELAEERAAYRVCVVVRDSGREEEGSHFLGPISFRAAVVP